MTTPRPTFSLETQSSNDEPSSGLSDLLPSPRGARSPATSSVPPLSPRGSLAEKGGPLPRLAALSVSTLSPQSSLSPQLSPRGVIGAVADEAARQPARSSSGLAPLPISPRLSPRPAIEAQGLPCLPRRPLSPEPLSAPPPAADPAANPFAKRNTLSPQPSLENRLPSPRGPPTSSPAEVMSKKEASPKLVPLLNTGPRSTPAEPKQIAAAKIQKAWKRSSSRDLTKYITPYVAVGKIAGLDSSARGALPPLSPRPSAEQPAPPTPALAAETDIVGDAAPTPSSETPTATVPAATVVLICRPIDKDLARDIRYQLAKLYKFRVLPEDVSLSSIDEASIVNARAVLFIVSRNFFEDSTVQKWLNFVRLNEKHLVPIHDSRSGPMPAIKHVPPVVAFAMITQEIVYTRDGSRDDFFRRIYTGIKLASKPVAGKRYDPNWVLLGTSWRRALDAFLAHDPKLAGSLPPDTIQLVLEEISDALPNDKQILDMSMDIIRGEDSVIYLIDFLDWFVEYTAMELAMFKSIRRVKMFVAAKLDLAYSYFRKKAVTQKRIFDEERFASERQTADPVFRKHDTSGKGLLDVATFHAILVDLGINMDRQSAACILVALSDVSGDGSVRITDFLDWYLRFRGLL
eukprot:TRINITY_DN349_c2_g1_i2.p1 TRINITY_DN349_c2_g1~~TRINITY_DN349_c2_g1_i2.p1  ORF type:complete len:631 (-),score=141.00 TRINITY_DN349_c2_g1_i2:29-1921(-)